MPRTTVKIPTPLRSFAGGATELSLEGTTVGAVLGELAGAHPALKRHLFTPEGRLRSFVTIYLNDEDIRSLEREGTPLKDGDVVSIVPAVAGGAPEARARPPTEAPKTRSMGTAPGAFSTDELRRYSRHLLLTEVGLAGQKKLNQAKVLLVGTGGLGAPAALYLAAAGVGEIGLVDFDAVDLSNLQRQVLYSTRDVGRPKIAAARERLEGLNPAIRIVPHEVRLSSENALDILAPYDVIVDGTDNFSTRYLVNDATVLLRKPNVYGSIYRFEGQVSVFDARHGPCYRCLYPEPPPPDLVPSCAEAGVLGVLPGLIGVLQATETVKLILGQGDSLVGRLLLYDALSLKFRELKVRKNPHCVICSSHPTQTGLIDYPAFCGVRNPAEAPADSGVPRIEPEALRAELDSDEPPFLVDVREPGEWAIAHLPGAHLIPKRELADRVDELTRAAKVVVYCRSGVRSAEATRFLLDLGFSNVRTLRGGLNAWAQRVDPSVPQY
ncbi:MAG TPA: molybdopterin-synthase adenylyltransferase MoeB [Thermoplasmata archaeon]|nr:molybdopterin-synthase adenylyltransferase MoeB [Thermoplasmata archaeon]